MTERDKNIIMWQALHEIYLNFEERISSQRKSIVYMDYLKNIPFVNPEECIGKGIRNISVTCSKNEKSKLACITNTTFRYGTFVSTIFMDRPYEKYTFRDGLIIVSTYLNMLYVCARTLASITKEPLPSFCEYEVKREEFFLRLKSFYSNRDYWDKADEKSIFDIQRDLYLLVDTELYKFNDISLNSLSWTIGNPVS